MTLMTLMTLRPLWDHSCFSWFPFVGAYLCFCDPQSIINLCTSPYSLFPSHSPNSSNSCHHLHTFSSVCDTLRYWVLLNEDSVVNSMVSQNLLNKESYDGGANVVGSGTQDLGGLMSFYHSWHRTYSKLLKLIFPPASYWSSTSIAKCNNVPPSSHKQRTSWGEETIILIESLSIQNIIDYSSIFSMGILKYSCDK